MEFDNIELVDNIELEDSINDGSIADIEEEEEDGNVNKIKKFTKKRIHHRTEEKHESSSGSDSDDNVDVRNKFAILNTNPNELNWPLWCWYYVVNVSVTTFHAAEYCGEKLADFFGITSPKYQYVINEYHRLRQEELEEEEAEKREKEFERMAAMQVADNLESQSNQQNDNLKLS